MREFEFEFTDALQAGLANSRGLLFSKLPALSRCDNMYISLEDQRKVLRPLPAFLPGSAFPGSSVMMNVTPIDVEVGAVVTKTRKILDFVDFFVVIASRIGTGADVNFLFTYHEGQFLQLTNNAPVFSDGIAYDNVQAVMLRDAYIYWSKVMDYDFTSDAKGSGKLLWPFAGLPAGIGQVGDRVVVIGRGGILVMQPIADAPYWSSARIEVKVNTSLPFGFCRDWCFFFDLVGNLITFDGTELQRRGYRKQFDNFDPITRVQYSTMMEGFFISDFTTCFLLTKTALTESTLLPLITYEHEGAFYGTWENLAGEDECLVQTVLTDMGFRSRKHVSGVQCGADSLYPVYVSIGWRNDIRNVVQWSNEAVLGPDGYIAIPCSGVELCVRLRVKRHAELAISNLSTFFKYEDKRFLRSRYDNKINT